MKQGQIVTFYSYKGGVGRTMALANIAVLLSRWGYRTLVVDWDLEAPGLEYFFKDFIDTQSIIQESGLIDLLNEASRGKLESAQDLNWHDRVVSLSVPESKIPLHLLTAGKRGNGYFGQVRDFDVEAFYSESKGGLFIESLRNAWKQSYDFVLIDSRTGVTDIGGICTIQLPDLLVFLFTATEQGFHGAIDVALRASEGRQKLPVDRLRLLSIPIPTRFDTDKEFQISQQWLTDFAVRLSDIYSDWLPKNIEPRAFLEATKLPYISYFSFGERLAVLEQSASDPAGLSYAYETLAALLATNLEFVDELLTNRAELIRKASGSVLSTAIDSDKKPAITPEAVREQLLVEKHLEWLKSNGGNGKRLNLTGGFLTSMDLRGAILRKSVLNGVDLSRAMLDSADLSDADLTRANLREAHLDQTNLERAQLPDANLSNAYMSEAILTDADLRKADLRGANMLKADLSGAQLQAANLADANLTGAKLTATDFSAANLRRALFRHADLRDSNMAEASAFSMEQFSRANLSGARLPPEIGTFDLSEFDKRRWGLTIRYAAIIATCLGAILLEMSSETVGDSFSSSHFAVFGTSTSLFRFYLFLPMLIMVVYLIVQFHLPQVWMELVRLPTVFPDGRTLSRKVRPKFISNILQLYGERAADESLPLNRLQGMISVLIVWYAVPLTILYLSIRCLLSIQDSRIRFSLSFADRNIMLIALTVISLSSFIIAFFFHWSARRTLRWG